MWGGSSGTLGKFTLLGSSFSSIFPTWGNLRQLFFSQVPPPSLEFFAVPRQPILGRKTQKHHNKNRSQGTFASMSLKSGIISDYTIPRVPQCLSRRPNWVRPPPFPQASSSPPQNQRGGNTRQRVRSGRTRFERLKRKPGTLSTLCIIPSILLYQHRGQKDKNN